MILNGIGSAGNLGGAKALQGGDEFAALGGMAQGSGEPGVFDRLLANLGDVSGAADTALTDLSIGGDIDIHDVVLAVEMESLTFDLAVQIRNRLVAAYQEIFRMQV